MKVAFSDKIHIIEYNQNRKRKKTPCFSGASGFGGQEGKTHPADALNRYGTFL